MTQKWLTSASCASAMGLTCTFSAAPQVNVAYDDRRLVMREIEAKHFDWDRYAKRHAQLIEQCLGPNRGVKKRKK